MADYCIADPVKLCKACIEIFVGLGVPEEEAAIVSDSLVMADLNNVQSHGVQRVKLYADSIEKGGTTAKCNLKTICDFPAGAVLDAQGALGIVAAYKAMELAIAKAKLTGIAMVNVRHSNHFSSAAYFTNMATKERMIGFACSNAPSSMAPWGSRVKYLGTNPFSIGVPTGTDPMILDMATSVVARGKIILADKKGVSIPEGWAIDVNGNPTTNAADALAGCVLPFGGPKGSGISMMLDVIAGILSGSSYGNHLNNPLTQPELLMNTGHSFIAIDIRQFGPYEEFIETMDEMIAEVKNLDRAKGVDEIFIPGEIESRNNLTNQINGICLSIAVISELEKLANRFNIDFDIVKR